MASVCMPRPAETSCHNGSDGYGKMNKRKRNTTARDVSYSCPYFLGGGYLSLDQDAQVVLTESRLPLPEVPCEPDEDVEEIASMIRQAAKTSKGTVYFPTAESFIARVKELRKNLDQKDEEPQGY